MKKSRLSLVLALTLGVGLTLILLQLMGHAPTVYANPDTRYVAPGGTDLANDCTVIVSPCATVQHAVDVAFDSDEILVATGTFTDTHVRPAPSGYTSTAVLTQVLFITKSLTIRGGYTTTDWTAPYPLTQVTTLQAGGKGRVLFVTGTITFTAEGLVLAGGNDAGLGGCPADWGPETCGSGLYARNATVRLLSTVITHNVSTSPSVDNGGGAFFWNLGSASLISGSRVLSNTAGWGGGLLLLESDGVRLIGNRISGNQVITNGAGLNLTQSDATLIENTVSENVAGSDGGGVYLFRSAAVLTQNVVISNVASNNGGGMVLDGSPSTLTDNVVSGNRAANRGGGLYLNNSDATLSANAVSENGAFNHGGGFFLNNSDATLVGNTVSQNTASNNGGGLDISQSAARLIGNTVSGNDASTSGGGLNVSQSDAVLNSNTIFSNTATYGGGVYLFMGAPHLDGDLVSANEATVGGGLRLLSTTAALSNTIVVDNRAQDAGSGLNIYGSVPHLLHTTIARNGGGDGSGVHVNNGSVVTLLNTILVSHTVGITVTADSTATLDGVLWYGNALADTGGAGTVEVDQEVTGAPAFAGDGYHITLASAALDQGVGAGVATDIDGEWRPSGNGPDLGADEIPGLLAPDGERAVLPGNQLVYTHTLTNTAHLTQSFSLTIHSSEGYSVGVEPQTTGNLAAFGGSALVTVTVQVPADALSDTVDTTVVTATASTSGRDTATDVTTVLFDGVAPVLTPDRTASALPGGGVVYTHTLTNFANVAQSYDLQAGSSQGFNVTLEPQTTDNLAAFGGSSMITVTVQTSAGAISGTVDSTVVTATGSVDGQDAVNETTTILFNNAVPVLTPNRSQAVVPGGEVVYTHALTNSANAPLSFVLTADSSQGFTATVEPQTTENLAALSGHAMVTVTLQVPGDAISGTVDSTVVTATALSYPGLWAAVVDTTTVTASPWWSIYLPVVTRQYP